MYKGTRIFSHSITGHQTGRAGMHINGQDTRAEREAERFGSVGAQKDEENIVSGGAGGWGSRENEDEEVLGRDRLLYLAPGNHKAPGLLQCSQLD